ncbi:MAG: cytochrome b [Gammaproteobacteria bacterium]|nr:cytochrome b [Gammaproteobacteria bacterium]
MPLSIYIKTVMTALGNSHNHWGLVARLFHWLTAFIVLAMFILGLWMVDLNYYHQWYKTAPDLHKSAGISLFAFTLLRLIWRFTHLTPSPLASHSAFEVSVARFTHRLLYLLLFGLMLSGYLISTADGRALDVFKLFEIPAIIHGIDKQEDIAGTVHLILAIMLISIALLHASAALKHHFIDKDRTLKRMLGL